MEWTPASCLAFPLLTLSPINAPQQFRTYKIIYRRYAGLFFAFCVDISDNELSYVEAIHCFVEMLDRYFGNVCELDLVFNFHKAYTVRCRIPKPECAALLAPTNEPLPPLPSDFGRVHFSG